MKFRNLDSDGDWSFGNGRNCYVAGNQAIGLNIKTRLLSWFGDCFFDMAAGIDWLNRLGSKNQRKLLEADLKRVIVSSFGVTGINNFDTVLNVRAFTANYSVNTAYSAAYQSSITQGV